MKPSSTISAEIETRIDELLSKMTLEEKIGQTNQVHALDGETRDEIRLGKVGSLINASGALTGLGQSASAQSEVCNVIQRISIHESRLGIPLIFGRDVIHGYRTIFPIPLGQAASWNPELIQKAASISAKEATSDGIKWTFAPMIDITREPRWGRVAEGPGEDPYLGSIIAAAMVKGFQGNDLSLPDRLIACAKHFVGYGAAEGGRDYESAEISMPTLRDIYLPPYQAAVDAGVGTMMAAFHDLNGTPMSCNHALINGVLRNEYGFQGFVVSDWASIAELTNHGVADSRTMAAFLGLKAGVDMDMVSRTYSEHLAESLDRGFIKMSDLDQAVRRILRVKFLAGLFDNPFTDEARSSKDILTPENRAVARNLAQDSIILLKNNHNFLPLDFTKKIAFVGPLVHATSELFGTWTPDGRANEVQSLSDALLEQAPPHAWMRFADNSDDAVRLAAEVDLVVAVVGEAPSRSGENSNVSDLGLPPGQFQFIQALANQGTPIVLVVLAGRPLAIQNEIALSQSVLFVFHPGTEGGAAIADILFGRVLPVGKLPITIPRVTGQVPIYYNHKNSGRPIGQGGFFTRYVDSSHRPLFPFGFGLSYTTFVYQNLNIENPIMAGSNQISAEISNTGSRDGTEIAQLYLRDVIGSITRPVKQLKRFDRVFLRAGETKTVTFEISAEDLAFFGAEDRKLYEPGEFQVWIGPNSSDGVHGSFLFEM